jgi:hypothetical protein
MPGFDRTGPEREGPMTGRRMGRCNPESPVNKGEENTTNLPGRGLAQRRGRGAGRPENQRSKGKGLARGRGFGWRR